MVKPLAYIQCLTIAIVLELIYAYRVWLTSIILIQNDIATFKKHRSR